MSDHIPMDKIRKLLERSARLDEAERQMGSIAEGAIDLFLEYRDVHGYSEESARNQALIDMVEAASVEIPERGSS